MTITRVTIQVPPFPKPRGQLGKYGNMTHSVGGYRSWQDEMLIALRQARFKTPDSFHTICYIYHWVRKRGALPDGENLQGGTQDTLKKGEYIKDDNISIISSWYGLAVIGKKAYIELYICETFADFQFFVNNILIKFNR